MYPNYVIKIHAFNCRTIPKHMAQMLKLEDRNSLVLSKNSSDHSMKN